MKTQENINEIIQLSSEDDANNKPKVERKVKKKLKTLRKDQKQPKIQNYFEVKNKNYFSTFSQAQLPAQVRNFMIYLLILINFMTFLE